MRKRRKIVVGTFFLVVLFLLPFVAKSRAESQRWRCYEALHESRAPLSEYRRVLGPPVERWLEDGGRQCELFEIVRGSYVDFCYTESYGESMGVSHADIPLEPLLKEYLTGVRAIFSPERCEAALRGGP